MSQEYTPVQWVDETATEPGTIINKARLDQMQTAHHYVDGFEEVDAIPSADPGVDYHKVVYCTVDATFYRWDGTQWTKDIDDDTKALLLAHEADHANPHVVTKAQIGLGNVDNKASVSAWQSPPDNDHIPTEKLVKDSLDGKVDIVEVSSGIKFYGQSSGGPAMYQGTSGATTGITSIPLRDSSGRIKTAAPSADEDAATKKYVDDKDALAMHLTQTGNVNLTGNLTITGDITQNGSSYETHAEKVYTTNDYIITRDGATGALASGDYSGFQVKKYDGTNDGRLVIDNTGTARVGDVGDEQPLLTREESANINNGALLKWDGVNQKAVDEGTVGTDTKPIKIVNGVATVVANDLISSAGDGKINGHLDLLRNVVVPNVTSSTLLRRYGFKALDANNEEYYFAEIVTRRYANRSRILFNVTANPNTTGTRFCIDAFDNGRCNAFFEQYDSGGITKTTGVYDSDKGGLYEVFKTGYVANSGYTINVTYGVTFATAPKVFVTPVGSTRPENGLAVTNVTTTGFTLYHESDVVDGFNWIATTL